jgi:hypothetical protein
MSTWILVLRHYDICYLWQGCQEAVQEGFELETCANIESGKPKNKIKNKNNKLNPCFLNAKIVALIVIG